MTSKKKIKNRATENPNTNSEKLDWLMGQMLELNELLRGKGHEGMLAKVEKLDKGYYVFRGVVYFLTPTTVVALFLALANSLGGCA